MTAKYGLLGHPLGHSFSRGFHTRRFTELCIDAVYENFEIASIDLLADVLRRESTLRGLNVTIPYKQAIIPLLDALDPLAQRIGAVNVVRVEHVDDSSAATHFPGLRLTGYNSDIVGFRDSIRPMLGASHTKALILGTGGGSKAVKVALEDMGIATTYVSRSGPVTYADLSPEVMAAHTVVVNCTPVGMFPNVDACPDIPYDLLTPSHVCFDLIYNPAETLFLRRAAARGAAVKCGQEMLEGQAIESYRLWTEGNSDR